MPALQALVDSPHEVVAVYTQPDRPAGRGRKLSPSPVKQYAQEQGIPVEQPRTLRDEAAQATLTRWQADLMVVVAYGLILPQAVLDIPDRGCINIHASLLPRWRGAAPIQRAILAGDRQTGVCIMQMDAGLDTGAVIACQSTDIGDHETAGQLHDRLAHLGARLLIQSLADLAAGQATTTPQTEQGVSYAHKLEKAEAELDWSAPAGEIYNKIRAFNPWPVAQTHFEGQVLRIWQAQLVADNTQQPPGSVIDTDRGGIDVATGDGVLRILTLQRAGKKPVAAQDFINAYELHGKRFGQAG